MRLSELENIIVQTKSTKGLISKIYNSLLYYDSSGYDSLKLLWERDLDVTFTSLDWDNLSETFPKCTSVSIHEQNFKFFHRTYYTAVRLQKMFPDTSHICYKCNTHKGTFNCLSLICFGHVTTFRLSGRVFTL